MSNKNFVLKCEQKKRVFEIFFGKFRKNEKKSGLLSLKKEAVTGGGGGKLSAIFTGKSNMAVRWYQKKTLPPPTD